MNPELQALRDENARLRELVRTHEIDRDSKEFYERLLTEIGRIIGCGHIDERIPSCVENIVNERNDCVSSLRKIVVRNGVTAQGVKQIEDFLKSIGQAFRRG